MWRFLTSMVTWRIFVDHLLIYFNTLCFLHPLWIWCESVRFGGKVERPLFTTDRFMFGDHGEFIISSKIIRTFNEIHTYFGRIFACWKKWTASSFSAVLIQIYHNCKFNWMDKLNELFAWIIIVMKSIDVVANGQQNNVFHILFDSFVRFFSSHQQLCIRRCRRVLCTILSNQIKGEFQSLSPLRIWILLKFWTEGRKKEKKAVSGQWPNTLVRHNDGNAINSLVKWYTMAINI